MVEPLYSHAGDELAGQRFDLLHGSWTPVVGIDDDKFVATHAEQLHAFGQGGQPAVGNLLQYPVSGEMTVGIVDVLEVVQAEVNESEGVFFIPPANKVDHEPPAVSQAGKIVGDGEGADPLHVSHDDIDDNEEHYLIDEADHNAQVAAHHQTENQSQKVKGNEGQRDAAAYPVVGDGEKGADNGLDSSENAENGKGRKGVSCDNDRPSGTHRSGFRVEKASL